MDWCTAQCNVKMLLFCIETIMKASHNFKLDHPEDKEHILVAWHTFAMLFAPLGVLLVMKTLEDE